MFSIFASVKTRPTLFVSVTPLLGRGSMRENVVGPPWSAGPTSVGLTLLLDLRRVDRDVAPVDGSARLDLDGLALGGAFGHVTGLLLPDDDVLGAGRNASDLERAVLARNG